MNSVLALTLVSVSAVGLLVGGVTLYNLLVEQQQKKYLKAWGNKMVVDLTRQLEGLASPLYNGFCLRSDVDRMDTRNKWPAPQLWRVWLIVEPKKGHDRTEIEDFIGQWVREHKDRNGVHVAVRVSIPNSHL